ncbi:MAG: carboxypeptidase regulatory-like domain-containing protein [Planctomycetaceae bacterium]|nr:carboxypeptidase regulatory-like domain-containing protein [Planctomycetaceae bacterium]
MIKISQACLLSFVFSMVAVIGCGGGSNEELVDVVPVTGKITLNGEPLKGAAITFMPQDEGMGRPCFGATDDDGAYVIKTQDGRKGCPVGKFKVIISKFAMEDGTPVGEDPEAAALGMEHLPAQYSSGEQTQLSADVPEGGKTFDFPLEVKKK